MIKRISSVLAAWKRKREYKRQNAHNQTWLVAARDISCIRVGNMTWGGIHVLDYLPPDSRECQIRIGSYCSIAGEVKFMRGGEHRTDRISTFLFKNCFSLGEGENLKKSADILVGDDVWIGYGALILPGADIGQGAVIGAGSVVRGKVPPYGIYVGDKLVKYRFEKPLIEELMKLDYGKLTPETVAEQLPCFYTEVDSAVLQKLLDHGLEKFV